MKRPLFSLALLTSMAGVFLAGALTIVHATDRVAQTTPTPTVTNDWEVSAAQRVVARVGRTGVVINRAGRVGVRVGQVGRVGRVGVRVGRIGVRVGRIGVRVGRIGYRVGRVGYRVGRVGVIVPVPIGPGPGIVVPGRPAVCPPCGVPQVCDVVIYSDPNLTGKSEETGDNQPRLDQSGWQDQISSLMIKSGTWDFYMDLEFKGQVMRLSPGSYPALEPAWTKHIGSFMCVRQ